MQNLLTNAEHLSRGEIEFFEKKLHSDKNSQSKLESLLHSLAVFVEPLGPHNVPVLGMLGAFYGVAKAETTLVKKLWTDLEKALIETLPENMLMKDEKKLLETAMKTLVAAEIDASKEQPHDDEHAFMTRIYSTLKKFSVKSKEVCVCAFGYFESFSSFSHSFCCLILATFRVASPRRCCGYIGS